MAEEIWKDIKGYEGLYQVSNLGNIKNVKTNSIKELNKNNKNYYVVVCLVKDKKRKCFNLHRLVAEAFIPNPNCYKVVNHKDRNKANNNVKNLEWVSFRQNSYHWVYEEEKTMNKDMLFIKKFTNISIACICKKLNINRYNVLSNRASEDKIHLVKKELESQLKELLKPNHNYKDK